MNYQELAKTMNNDLTDYMVSKHYGKIADLYGELIDEYIAEKLGILNDTAHNKLKKHLLKLYIA